MSFENLKRYVKINPFSTIVYTCAGIGAGISLIDGIDWSDIPSLGFSATAVAIGMVAGKMKQTAYEKVGEMIQDSGFIYPVVNNELVRKLAKVYAQEHNLMEEFNAALRTHSIKL